MSSAYFEANRKVVSALYRQSLRQSKSWINRRDLWRAKALEIRQQFDENKKLELPADIDLVVEKTRLLLQRYRHPDPIIPPTRPGGTKYDRNVPPQHDPPGAVGHHH